MEIIVPGHYYLLNCFESKSLKEELHFIHKEQDKTDASLLVTVRDGTTNEEVLEVLIDRIKFLQDKFPCRENAIVLTHLEEALMWLEKRTKDRIKRKVEGKHMP
jgi:hypothetical protein